MLASCLVQLYPRAVSVTSTDLAAIRAALDAAGYSDVITDFPLGDENGLLRRAGNRAPLGALYRQADGSWLVALGKRGANRGGYRGSLGGEIGEPVDVVLRRAMATIVRPFGPPPTLEEELSERLGGALRDLHAAKPDAAAVVGAATDAAGAPFRWTPLFASEKKTELRAAFDVACTLVQQLEPGASRATKRRSLRARVWAHRGGSLAIWETAHDPGAGLLVQLGVWRAPVAAPLPPW
jgi:hypothetical protein